MDTIFIVAMALAKRPITARRRRTMPGSFFSWTLPITAARSLRLKLSETRPLVEPAGQLKGLPAIGDPPGFPIQVLILCINHAALSASAHVLTEHQGKRRRYRQTCRRVAR